MSLLGRVVGVMLGSLVFSVGLGFAWTLYSPGEVSTRCLVGGMLMPPAWVGAFLWLWPAADPKRLRQLVIFALLLWTAVAGGLLGPWAV